MSCPASRSRGGCVGDEPLQLADELGVAAGGEVGLDAQLERGEPLLLQARDLGAGERLERELGERRPAPQRERLAQGRRRGLRLAVRRARGAPSSTSRSKRSASSSPGARAGGSRRASCVTTSGSPSALRRRETCTCTVFTRAAGRVLAPQRERQPLGAHRLVGVQQQHGEHRARLDAAQRNTAGAVADLDRAEDQEFHRPAGRRYRRVGERQQALLPRCKPAASASSQARYRVQRPPGAPDTQEDASCPLSPRPADTELDSARERRQAGDNIAWSRLVAQFDRMLRVRGSLIPALAAGRRRRRAGDMGQALRAHRPPP